MYLKSGSLFVHSDEFIVCSCFEGPNSVAVRCFRISKRELPSVPDIRGKISKVGTKYLANDNFLDLPKAFIYDLQKFSQDSLRALPTAARYWARACLKRCMSWGVEY